MTLKDFEVLWWIWWNKEEKVFSFAQWLYKQGYMCESILVDYQYIDDNKESCLDAVAQQAQFHEWKKEYDKEVAYDLQQSDR